MQRIDQQIHCIHHRKTQIMKIRKTRNVDLRRTRTRTLIQLGGLVEKSGLSDLMGIELCQDLQQDVECFEGAAMLFGALLELKSYWQQDDIAQQKLLWIERGKREMCMPIQLQN